MSDQLDQANQSAEHDLRISLCRSHRAEPHIIANGYCHNCAHPIPDGHRWCDADCRNEWEAEGWGNGY